MDTILIFLLFSNTEEICNCYVTVLFDKEQTKLSLRLCISSNLKNIYHHITSTIKILIRNLHFMLEYHMCCDFIL